MQRSTAADMWRPTSSQETSASISAAPVEECWDDDSLPVARVFNPCRACTHALRAKLEKTIALAKICREDASLTRLLIRCAKCGSTTRLSSSKSATYGL